MESSVQFRELCEEIGGQQEGQEKEGQQEGQEKEGQQEEQEGQEKG